MHETLPTASNPRTTNPRQWTHGKTPARFIAETRGPSSPSAITTPAKAVVTTWTASRECLQRKNRPRIGVFKKSKPVLEGGSQSGRVGKL